MIVNWKEKPHESLSLHLLHCNLNNWTCWTWRGATQPYCFPFPRGRQEICCDIVPYVCACFSPSLSLTQLQSPSLCSPPYSCLLFPRIFFVHFQFLCLFPWSSLFLCLCLWHRHCHGLSLSSSYSFTRRVFVYTYTIEYTDIWTCRRLGRKGN